MIMIGLSLLNADFTKTGDTVKDSISKLEFQDDTVGSKMTWESAISYCENLTLSGHSDWRLPNINELKSIIDRSGNQPHIVYGFQKTSYDYPYWSSTSYEIDEFNAWYVNFDEGSVYYDLKAYNYYVRCVRDGE